MTDPSRPPVTPPQPPPPSPNQPPPMSPEQQPPGRQTSQDAPTRPADQEAPTNPNHPPMPPAADATKSAPGFDEHGRVRAGKVSGIWIGLIGTALFLILLVIFIAQNSRKVSLHFLGWHGQFSLALTILLSAVIGVLLVAIPGSVRILQLRRALRKNGPGRS